ncbi:sensor histidine kinase [Rubrivivax sp. A210]|uniref:sensor histidine kinase n=1 Tax=Rubrivivax sp. A210 TaxID=2772301 RepID=UPI00191B02B5|nr:sensor histidine kinase [Rubrivivax sp. A210]
MWALLLLAGAAWAQEPLVLGGPGIDSHDGAGHLAASPRGAAPATAAEALALYRSGGFERLPAHLGRGYDPQPVWIAFDLVQDTAMSDGEPAAVVVEVGPAYLDRITAYRSLPDGSLQALGEAGDQVDKHLRPLPALKPAFALRLTPGQPTTVLLRLQTASTQAAIVTLYHAPAFAAAQLTEGLVLGAILTISAVMMLLALGLWLIYRDAAHLLWLLYVGVTGLLWFLIDGLADRALALADRSWINHATLVFSIASMVVGTLFLRTLFELRALAPWLHHLLGVWAASVPVVMALSSFARSPLLMGLVLVSSVPIFALVAAAIVWLMLRRHRTALFFGPAFLLYLGATLNSVLATLGWAPLDNVSFYGWQLAGLCNLLSLQVAIFDLARRTQRQLQAERQSLLQDLAQRNEALEQGVQARTLSLETALRELRQAEADQRQLLAMASHEFRTPAAMIKASLDSLALVQHTAPPEVATRLHNIRAASQRLIRLANDLIASDRLREPTLPVQRADIDLRDALHEVARHYPAGTRLQWTALEQPLPVRADPALLNIALHNLIDNALRYHPEQAAEAVQVRLALAADAQPPQACIQIADRGAGIPDEAKDKVFDRFFVLTPASSGPAGGRLAGHSGLGLSIVKSIALAHGGTVAVSDNPPAGSVFELRLPLLVAAAPTPA